jgi:poly-gamma-glutamate capsule biosynthesis protein CapA/YwtB (metallophosphatase superfamily)
VARWVALVCAALMVAACGASFGERVGAAPETGDPDTGATSADDDADATADDDADAPAGHADATADADADAGVDADADLSADTGDADSDADAAAPDPPRRFTIAATGDILPHTAVIRRAADYGAESGEEYDFRPMFADIAPVLGAADLAICHLEVPLSADNADVFGGGDRRTAGGAPLFTSPWQLATAIGDAGFDSCSTAHNHSSDAGEEGIVATLDALEGAGVVSAGTYRSPEEVDVPVLHDVEGVTVAHLSATYGLNVPLPEGATWMVDVIEVGTLVADAEAARDAGAEFVVVSLHHGLEYQIEPSDHQRARSDELLASDAIDLLLGHHAHVVQPIDLFHDQVAVHGLGNLLSNMDPAVTGPHTQDGVIVLLEVTEDVGTGAFDVTDVSYVATWVDRDTHVVVDVGAALDTGDLDQQRRADLEASWDRTVAGITLDGADGWGVTPRSGPAWISRTAPG